MDAVFLKKHSRKFFFSFITIITLLALVKAFNKSNDFHTYYRTASRLISGNLDIYTLSDGQGPFWYPPFFAYVFSIFGLFSGKTAQLLWGIINVFFAGGLYFQIKKIFFAGREPSLKFWTLLILSSLYPILSNFQTGNIHIMLLFMMLLFFRFFKYQKNFYSSLFLSMAALFKVTPFILYSYIIFKKRWEIALFVPLCGMAIILIPGIFIGFEKNFSLHKTFIEFLPLYDQVVDLSRETIQSLAALSLRYFSHVRDRYLEVNILTLPRETSLFISKIISVLIVIPSAFLFIKNYNKDFEYKLDIEFSIMLVALSLLTPSAFIHTLVFLIPAYASIILYFYKGGKSSFLKAATLTGWALITFSPDFFLGNRLNNLVESLSIPVLGIILIFFSINYLYHLKSTDSTEPSIT